MKLVAMHLHSPFCYISSLTSKHSDQHSFVSHSVYWVQVARSYKIAKLKYYTNITVFWDTKPTEWCTGPVIICKVADYPTCGDVKYKLFRKTGILISTTEITSNLVQLRMFSSLDNLWNTRDSETMLVNISHVYSVLTSFRTYFIFICHFRTLIFEWYTAGFVLQFFSWTLIPLSHISLSFIIFVHL